MRHVMVTTSWDDGHVLDLRLAELLKKYGIKGTFYIAPRDYESHSGERLTDKQIYELSQDFEIGAHTMTHHSLPDLTDDVAKAEIRDSKGYLGTVIGRGITSFCYPRGSYQPKHIEMVREAGFTYARTVTRHSYGMGPSPLEGSTTIHTYNHWSDLWKIARFARFSPAKTIKYFQWDVLAKAMFDRALEEGGIFHLWGHSWEIDGHGDWQKLESVLAYIAHKRDVRYVTNGEILNVQTKKVLIVTPYFPPHLGGVESYTYNIAKGLEAAGWEVCVATTSAQRGFRVRMGDHDGLKVYYLPYILKPFNTPLHPFWYFHIKGIIRRERPNIVNAHAPVVGLADMSALAARHTPFVLTYHAGTMRKGSRLADSVIWLYEHVILPRTASKANKILCASEFVRDSVFTAFKDKAVVVTPGVDIEVFKPSHDTKKRSQEILFVSSLAAMHQLKGLHVLVDAVESLAVTFPAISLKVIGEKGHSDSTYVHFAGPMRGEALAQEMQGSAVLALCSLAQVESFGMVLVEAMACGLPVIGTNTGGIPEIIRNGENGITVEPGNAAALAQAIGELLSDGERAQRMGEAGRRTVETGFTWETRIRKTSELFEGILV